MMPLHKNYKWQYPIAAEGYVVELDDVLVEVRKHWPNAYMEGSAGLARMYLDRETHLFVAYAWCTRKVFSNRWHYLIFKEGQHC